MKLVIQDYIYKIKKSKFADYTSSDFEIISYYPFWVFNNDLKIQEIVQLDDNIKNQNI